MNAQAVAVEKRAARPLMSSFHAAFSIGGLAGALFGAAMASPWRQLLAHFLLPAVLSLAVLLFSSRYLLDDQRRETRRRPSVQPAAARLVGPGRRRLLRGHR